MILNCWMLEISSDKSPKHQICDTYLFALTAQFSKMRCDMEKSEKIYIDLQRHIDSQAIGFPATKTGSELRILKHIFTPKEAEIAKCLT